MNEITKKIEYFITIFAENAFLDQKKWNLMLKIIGDKSESQEILLDKDCIVQLKQGSTLSTNRCAFIHKFKININEVGKIKKVNWIDSINLGVNNSSIYEIQIENPYRNELLLFPIDKTLNHTMNLILEPNLNPGDVGVHYAVVCHTNYQQKQLCNKSPLNICIQIKGEKKQTNFIPLQHSQLNKAPFLAGRRDIFDVIAVDVGKITKIFLKNHNENNLNNNSWFIDNLEIRTFNQSHVYNFHVIKNLLPNEELELTPMSHSEIDYEVVLRYNKIENEFHPMNHNKFNDIYFIICGEKGSTKKIYLNNYESRPQTDPDVRERFFEFKSEDVGKIIKANVSLNEDSNPNNCIFIEYIEIKIPSRKEAYKFPCERTLGAFFEDGRLELDLEVWKHPEKKIHIDYEFRNESILAGNDKNTCGTVYLIIHGDHGKTGKIELNDGSLENGSDDDYLFNAPDVGKINKIEIFYTPTLPNSTWRIDSLEIRIASRNEAYKFPVQLYLDKHLNHLQLEPWKKPNINRQTN